MGERIGLRRRVLIEDARRNGHHLRATSPGATRQIAFSTCRADVCTGATRAAYEDVAELAGLMVEGLADSAGTSSPAPPSPEPRPATSGLGDRARAWWRTFRGMAA